MALSVMKTLACCVLSAMLGGVALAEQCDSINASYAGNWKPASTAPRDGTVVELMQTYGVAPWYGRFKWTKTRTVSGGQMCSGFGKNAKCTPMKPYKITSPTAEWVNVDDENSGVDDDECLFWRPTKSTGKYVDPTGGAQKSVAYWCAAVHRSYDAKTDSCK